MCLHWLQFLSRFLISVLCLLVTLPLFQDMVVLPYKDSLLLLSRYLQQLVMESLGKEFDLDGNRVCILASLLPVPDVLYLHYQLPDFVLSCVLC